MLSLADVLELPVVRRALPEVVVGDAELGREIRWAHVIEMPDPDDLLKGGELVLTTGLGAGADAAHQARWTASLIDQGVAALAVELGSSWRDVPPPVVAGCARAGVPVVAFHRPVRFIEITEAVHGAVVNAQFALLARGEEIHRRFTELILQGRGVPEILAELCAAIGNPVVFGGRGRLARLLRLRPARRRSGAVRLGRRAPRHRRGRLRGRRPAARLVVGPAAGARARQADRRLRQSRGRARGARGRDRPAGQAARRAAAGPLARRVPVRAGRRARGGGRRAPARRGARPVPRPAAATCCRSWRRGARLGSRAAAAPTASPGRVCRAICAPRCPRPASPSCSGPRDVDLLILLALGSRGYDASLPEHVADLFHGALDRHGLGPADAALAIGAPVGRVGRRRAGAAAGAALGGRGDGAPGRALARRAPARRRRSPARPARFARARRVRRRAARPAAGRRRRRAPARCWRRSRRTWRRAAGRRRRRARSTSSASRCTCGCAGSRKLLGVRSTTRTSRSDCTSAIPALEGSARRGCSLTVRRARRR